MPTRLGVSHAFEPFFLDCPEATKEEQKLRTNETNVSESEPCQRLRVEERDPCLSLVRTDSSHSSRLASKARVVEEVQPDDSQTDDVSLASE